MLNFSRKNLVLLGAKKPQKPSLLILGIKNFQVSAFHFFLNFFIFLSFFNKNGSICLFYHDC